MQVNLTPGSGQEVDFSNNQIFPGKGSKGAEISSDSSVSKEEMEKAFSQIKESVEIFNKRFRFKIHEGTKRIQVQVIDQQTGKVLDEIPPDKILDLLATFKQFTGLLVDVKA